MICVAIRHFSVKPTDLHREHRESNCRSLVMRAHEDMSANLLGMTAYVVDRLHKGTDGTETQVRRDAQRRMHERPKVSRQKAPRQLGYKTGINEGSGSL